LTREFGPFIEKDYFEVRGSRFEVRGSRFEVRGKRFEERGSRFEERGKERGHRESALRQAQGRSFDFGCAFAQDDSFGVIRNEREMPRHLPFWFSICG
jgi:hypothetical protein